MLGAGLFLPPGPARARCCLVRTWQHCSNHRGHLRPRSAHLEGGAAFFSCRSELIKENKLLELGRSGGEHPGRIVHAGEASTDPEGRWWCPARCSQEELARDGGRRLESDCEGALFLKTLETVSPYFGPEQWTEPLS